MKKIFGLLAVCALVACNDSSENVAGPQQWGNQNGQQQGQLNQDSLAAAIADSIARAQQQQQQQQGQDQPFSSTGFNTVSSSSFTAVPASSSAALPASSAAVPASSAVAPKSSAATPKSSAVIEEDDGLFKLQLWDGSAGEAQVQTGNKQGGWWYSYADDLGSEITWDAEVGADGSMAAVIESCGGICGSFSIGEGDPDEGIYPYLGFAFGYGKTASATGDATSIRGICVTYSYSGTATFAVELGMTSAQENKLGSALPMAVLPKGTKKTEDFAWSAFEQPDWATTAMTGTNAAKQLSSIKFKFADVSGGESGTFAIYKVGPLGSCD